MHAKTLAKSVSIVLLFAGGASVAGCSGAGTDDVTTAALPSAQQLEVSPKVIEEAPDLAADIPEEARRTLLAQIPLSEAASQLRSAVEEGDDGGFAGIELTSDAVILWWKGELSPSMAVRIAEANKTVPIKIKAAAHTRAELRAAAARLLPAMKVEANRSIHQISSPVDGSGLIIGTEGSLAAATTLFTPNGDVPLTFVRKERMHFASRLADSPRFWGGARIVNRDNGAQCSSGFAVKAGSRDYLLTAGHCGRVGGGWWNGNRSWFLGNGSREHARHDLLLIDTEVSGRIYDGGVNRNEFSKGVANWGWVHAGESLCTSGSFSGAICGFRVTRNFTASVCDYDAYGHYECYDDLIVADNGARGIRSGDSGGPVFSLASNNRVTAKGTITGEGPGVMGFQDFGTATRDFGITVVTN